MKIECLEYFGVTQENGTLKVRVPELGVIISGISCFKMKKGWFLLMPGSRGKRKDTQEKVRYTYLFFEDAEKQKEFMAALIATCSAFCEEEHAKVIGGLPRNKLKYKKMRKNAKPKETNFNREGANKHTYPVREKKPFVPSVKGKNFFTPTKRA